MNKPHNHILLSIKNSKKIINAEGTQYPIIAEVAIEELGFLPGVDHFTFLWTDQLLSIKQIRMLEYPKRVNHIPDISQITRKNKLAMNLNGLKIHFPKDYNFYPQTWITPTQLHKIYKKHTKNTIYIVKPQNSCQGKGISLIDSPNKIDKNDNLIIQEYLPNPFLINGLKFDMRIYVLITSVSPLRVYIYKEGIVRFATEKFQTAQSSNLSNNFSHLTNYAINKNNENFDNDQLTGHKRSLTSVYPRQQDFRILFTQIKDIVIKTIISSIPSLQNAYSQCKKTDPSSCFQLLGFDIILDEYKKAYLLQVNQNPSLHTDTKIDYKIKSNLVKNVFNMVSGGLPNIFQDKMQNKMKVKDRHQLNNIGQFQRAYPCRTLQQTQKYDAFLLKSHEIYRQKFGINIVRNLKKKQKVIQTIEVSKVNNISSHVNNIQGISSFYYSKQKMQNIYKSRNTRYQVQSSLQKKRVYL